MDAPTVSLAPLLQQRELLDNPQQDVLSKLLSEEGYQRPSCRNEALKLLEQAGLDRFLWKSRSYHRQAQNQPAEEVLYQSLMEAAGYSENRSGFLKLAQKAPFHLLTHLAKTGSSEPALPAVQQYLLETAGFEGPSTNSQPYIPPVSPVSSTSWHLFRVRPSNHPRRRIRGMASLIVRYHEAGLIEGLRQVILQDDKGLLERGLIVSGPEGSPALIGHSRASDMAVNVVLPFFHSWGLKANDKRLENIALNLFHGWPSLQNNSIVSSTEEALFPGRWLPLARGACQQQGVLHLQRLLKGERAEAVDSGRV